MDPSSASALPQWDYPKYEPGQPVGLFVPCYIDQFYPKIAEDTVTILERLGVPVEFPDQQTCCGQPAFNSGYWEEAGRVIRHFCNVFRDYQFVVCPSASCTAMCRVFFEQVDPSPAIAGVGSRVFELAEFLVEVLGVSEIEARFPRKVTFHSGCHGRRELGVLEQPLKLLRSVRDLEYCELPNMDECCGFGGTFSVKMAGTSLAMGQTKVQNILKTGADVVVSSDISCLMHIGGIMRKMPETRHIETLHIANVLASNGA